jgi:catechol 2,3-dioxygenase-like lactoylglutathione lyase family enzyme
MKVLFDHIALAAAQITGAPNFLVGELGGESGFGGPAGEYTFWHWDYTGGGRIEVIEPDGAPGGFVHRFLKQRGPGIHHVTFKVPSLREACDRAKALGYEIVGFNDGNAHWQEAFLHPKQALGVVVQMVENAPREDGDHEHRWGEPPPSPADAPPSVEVVGLRMRSGDREASIRQWRDVLLGELEEADRELVFRWPGSSMRVAVTLEEGGANESEAIEVRAERDLNLPRRILGAEFRKLEES